MVQILYYIFAAIAIFGAFVVIIHKNPIYSAMALILTFFSLAGIYVLLSAHFIAIVHIAVYAGAIMVLFLFTVMLLNIRVEKESPSMVKYMKWVAFPVAILLLAELAFVTFSQFSSKMITENDLGTVENIGKNLFTEFVFPFEITSVLLIVAIIGALYLSKKRIGTKEAGDK